MDTILAEARGHFWSRGPEVLVAGGLIAEGRKIASFETLTGEGTTRSYAVLADLINGVSWGVFGIAIGAVWIAAVVLNGTYPRFRRISPWIRTGSGLLAMFYWSVFAFGMNQGNPASTGFESHGTLAAVAAFLAFRVAREVGVMEGEVQRCRQRQSRR